MVTRNSLLTDWNDRQKFLVPLYARWERLGVTVAEIRKAVEFELWRDRVAQ